MKSTLLALSCILASFLAFAQVDTTVVEETQYYDDTVYQDEDEYGDYQYESAIDPELTQSTKDYMNEDVPAKKFDNEEWKKVVGDVNFDEKPPKREVKKEQRPKKGSNFSMPGISPGILKAISFVLVFVLFAFILYYVSRNTTFSQSIKKMKPADVSAPVENIEELDTEGLLQQALASGDLRLAVRIHYLLLLKKLNEVGLIAWKKNKTNRDYLSELFGKNNCYDDVRALTLAYELVWYGERSVSSESFQRLSGEFESVNSRITQVQSAV